MQNIFNPLTAEMLRVGFFIIFATINNKKLYDYGKYEKKSRVVGKER